MSLTEKELKQMIVQEIKKAQLQEGFGDFFNSRAKAPENTRKIPGSEQGLRTGQIWEALHEIFKVEKSEELPDDIYKLASNLASACMKYSIG